MHKPIRIIKDDARVRLTQQVNLVSALRVSLLSLPENFSEIELFEKMAGFSYQGDPRMAGVVPGENKGKVGNIVRAQSAQFTELYQRLANGLPGVHWATGSSSIQQDTSPKARATLLKKLPSNLYDRLEKRYGNKLGGTGEGYENDSSAFWTKVGADEGLERSVDEGTSCFNPPLLFLPSLGLLVVVFPTCIRN